MSSPQSEIPAHLHASILDLADAVLSIPMRGFLPSYNLQAAMAVVMGERLRQTTGK